MISLTNHDFQWGRSEVVIIYPDTCSFWSPIPILPAQDHHTTPAMCVQQLAHPPLDGLFALQQLRPTLLQDLQHSQIFFLQGKCLEQPGHCSVHPFRMFFWLMMLVGSDYLRPIKPTQNTCCRLNSQYISHVLLVASWVCRSFPTMIPWDYTLNLLVIIANHVSWW